MTSRAQKGQRIGRTPGSVRRLTREVYAVAGDSSRIYIVRRDEETCECKDHQYQTEACKHLIAVEVFVADERRYASRVGTSDTGNPAPVRTKRSARKASTYKPLTAEDIERNAEKARAFLAYIDSPSGERMFDGVQKCGRDRGLQRGAA